MDSCYPFLRSSAAAAVAFVVFLAGVALSGPARAQESDTSRAPLEMTFVDATPDTSGAIHEKLRQIIANSDDINFTKPEKFLFSAEEFDITLEVLGSEDKRNNKSELLRRALRGNELEALVIYKRTGDTLHLIVIGPNGGQLKHFESPIKRSQLSDEQAVKVLKKLFGVLVPEVRAFREQQAEQQQPEETLADDQQSDESDEQQTNAGSSGSTSGPLGSNVTVSLSPIGGRRSLTMNSRQRQEVLSHVTPFLGGGARLDATFGVLSSNNSALGATVDVQYGRFSTQFGTINRTVQGTTIRAEGAFRYLGGLSEDLALYAQLGLQSFDVGLESNSIYVGSSYVALLGGPGLLYRIGDVGQLEINANLLPVLGTNTNDDAFGNSSLSVGANAEARFTIYSFKPVLLSAYYNLDLYQPTHDNPPEYSGPASGTDLVHIGGLSVGYQF